MHGYALLTILQVQSTRANEQKVNSMVKVNLLHLMGIFLNQTNGKKIQQTLKNILNKYKKKLIKLRLKFNWKKLEAVYNFQRIRKTLNQLLCIIKLDY